MPLLCSQSLFEVVATCAFLPLSSRLDTVNCLCKKCRLFGSVTGENGVGALKRLRAGKRIETGSAAMTECGRED